MATKHVQAAMVASGREGPEERTGAMEGGKKEQGWAAGVGSRGGDWLSHKNYP